MHKRISLLWAAAFGFMGTGALGQSADELINAGKNTDNVPVQGMGYHLRNYSPLDQINKGNVKRLVPVWSISLMNNHGETAQPTVYNGVMYVVNATQTFAIDVATGRQLWRTEAQWAPDAAAKACCGVTARGTATIYNGKLYRITLDNYVLALDMKTGKEVWKQKFADHREGYTATSAPLIANGVLITGMAGGEFTTRGFLNGWDPETGKHLWKTYTVPAPGEKGAESWPQDTDAWKTGGAPTWRSGAYDPALDLVYWGTGNPAPWTAQSRNALDGLYASSLLAIRPKTGEIVWHYQYTPNDVWDVDGTDEPVLADITFEGKPRKVLFQMNKNGFGYTIDRTNGQLLAAHPFTRVNWATSIDLKTGRPVVNQELYEKIVKGEQVSVYPQRGVNAVPVAYNPAKGLIYTSSWNIPRVFRVDLPPKPQVLGQRSTGVISIGYTPKPGEIVGHHIAFDPVTGKKKWEIPLERGNSSGMLATGGGLIFTGEVMGKFIALDEDTGKTLWEFQTSSGINATAVTYTHKGRQYVSIASGLGGNSARAMSRGGVPLGGSMWTFALMPD